MSRYSEAVKRPFQDFKKFVIGALLFSIPFVNIITSLFAYGYIFRCAKTAMQKRYKLPEWRDWGNLFVEGLLISIIGLLYFLPALVFGILSGFAALWAMIAAEQYPSAMIPIGISLIFSGLLAILTVYVVPSAILTYAKTNRFMRAFSLATVFKKAFSHQYMTAWAGSIIYALVLSAVAYTVALTLFASVIGPFIITGILSFVLGVTTVTMIGEAYGEIT